MTGSVQKRFLTGYFGQFSDIYETLRSSKIKEERNTGFYESEMKLVEPEMSHLTYNIRKLFNSCNPILYNVANYYIETQGKHVRPLVVLLISKATSIAPKIENWEDVLYNKYNEPISSSNIVNDEDPDKPLSSYEISMNMAETDIYPSQRRLAEITEMIHTASLLHDDVIDNSHIRRGMPSGNHVFGNKMAVLAGDFLLGRASLALARLRNAEVIELLATVIANLVEGEIMQLKGIMDKEDNEYFHFRDILSKYLKKTYLKTASLIAKSCRATTLLGGCTSEITDNAYLYGKNLGLAFQLTDDMLDYTISEDTFGKPVKKDLKLGLITAPVLFAWEKYPELGPVIKRKFSNDGDICRTHELVIKSNGLQKTKELAEKFCNKALDSLNLFPVSPSRHALEELTYKILNRAK
ncbi:hypothetical protein T552_02152 [Pneumocystis carinii B80]|uniref:Hexaprenyl pyrophosphate synthase, mitochondrial n=1 Tax=Pneumocystis carinii (strain B80) TaxID=1408658 RepID=A0A0W4ZH58_PNEC8|nr:hypothetical protein T552_02152 [Pneumocystis carinii B80]KTW27712.1 hypothetical protein T552_02152 [Pneumocystis carinii B80]